MHSSREAGYAESTIDIVAENNAYLEYIGNINIMFPSSALTNHINVRLHAGSTILISDTYLMHDPDAQGKHFADLETSMRVISANETLLTLDRLHITGPDLAIQLTAVDIEFDTHSTIYLLMGDSTDKQIAGMLESIHTAINNLAIKAEDAYIGVGTLPNQCGLFVRLLSHSGEPVNHLVKALSALARQHNFNQ